MEHNKKLETRRNPEELFNHAIESALENGFSVVPRSRQETDRVDVFDQTLSQLNQRTEEGGAQYREAPARGVSDPSGDFFVLPDRGEGTVAAFVVESGRGEVQVLYGKSADIAQLEAGDVVLVSTDEPNRRKRPWVRFEDEPEADQNLRYSAIGVNGNIDSSYYDINELSSMGAVNRRALRKEANKEQDKVQRRYERAQRRIGRRALHS